MSNKPDQFEPENIRQKLKTANIYLNQSLFNDAREIYESIIGHYQAQLKNAQGSSKEEKETLQGRIKLIENKLREIEQQQTDFRDPTAPEKKIGAAVNAETLFNKGIALKGIGLYDDAISAFKLAADFNYRPNDCCEEIGSVLIEKGAYGEGIATLRQIYNKKEIEPDQKTSILDKIASAYELSANDTQKALEVYQELIGIDKTHKKASRKILQLAGKQKRFHFSLAPVTKYPLAFLVFSILIFISLTIFNPYVKTVDNVDYFTLENDPDTLFYNNFKEVFGNDEFFIIAFKNKNVFSADFLIPLQKITEELENLEEVEEITSLTNVEDVIGTEDYFEVRNFIEEIPDNRYELEQLKEAAHNNSLYVKNFISDDCYTAAIIVEAFEKPDDEGYRKRLLYKTGTILDKYRKEIGPYYIGGWTSTNLSLSQYLKADMMVFLPVTYILIIIIIWLFFKNIRLTILAVVNISVCVSSTRGLMGLTGIELNNVTSIIMPLVMALALCDTVHIFSQLNKSILNEFPNKINALAHVLKKVALPCFLTTLTTAIGFISLLSSELPPIRDFAIIASCGMILEFIFSFFLLPPLLLFCNPDKIYQEHKINSGMSHMLRRISELVIKHNKKIVAASLILVLIFGWQIGKIRIDNNLINFFKKTSAVRTSIDFIERHLCGVGSVDISLKADRENAFKEPSNLQIIDNIQQYINFMQSVDKTVSLVDFIKDMNESFHNEDSRYYRIPESMEMISQYLLIYDSDNIEDFINSDYDHARIYARISEHSSAGQAKIIQTIKKYIQTTDHPGLDIRVTGRAVNDVNIVNALVKGQVYSLAITAIIISIIMLLVLKSVAIGFLSMIPNFFPVLINFGIMGIAGIPLDTGTALIAAVALGIAVDDTIHFLSEYKIKRGQNISIPKAVTAVTYIKGRAIISSSLILCAGFGVMIFSRFIPIIYFGLLCAIIMITAVIGDLIVLPACLLLKKNK